MNLNKAKLLKFIFLVLALLPILLLAEATPEAKQQAHEIYQEFLSPFCPGRALSDCPSSKADLLKNRILNELSEGQTKEAVLHNLETEFGAEYNAKPKLTGFAGLAWMIPLGFILILLILGIFWIKRASSLADQEAD